MVFMLIVLSFCFQSRVQLLCLRVLLVYQYKEYFAMRGTEQPALSDVTNAEDVLQIFSRGVSRVEAWSFVERLTWERIRLSRTSALKSRLLTEVRTTLD